MSDLPKGWIKIPLQVGLKDLLTGRRPKGGVQGITEGLLSLGGEHINANGYINLNKPRYIPIDFAQKISTAQVMANDILVVKDGATTGRVGLVDNRFTKMQAFVNEHLFLCRSNEFLDPIFLYHYLKSEKGLSAILSDFRGAAQGGISRQFIDKVFMPLPPLAEQKRIVTKLDSLFAHTRRAREELDHIPKLIERYKQAILSAAFRGDLTADWRKENLLTEEWKELALKEFLSEPLSNGRSVCDGDGFPVLRLTCLKDRLIDLNENKKGIWTREEALKFLVRTKDFFVSRGNGSLSLVGKGSLVGVVTDEIAYPDTLIRVRVEPEVYNVEFLSFIWNSYFIRRQIEKAAKTTAGIYKINQKSIENFIFPIPSLQEQQEIVEKLKNYFQAIDRLEQEYQKAIKLCDRLEQTTLAKAFRGEIVPQDPNDEPASLLLERIQKERENQKPPKKKQLSLLKPNT